MRQQPPDEPGDESQACLADMRREMDEMRALVRHLISANAVENVLINGFTTLSAQLEPLAELAPPRRVPMKPAEMARLEHVRAELKRQDWTGSGLLRQHDRFYDATYVDGLPQTSS